MHHPLSLSATLPTAAVKVQVGPLRERLDAAEVQIRDLKASDKEHERLQLEMLCSAVTLGDIYMVSRLLRRTGTPVDACRRIDLNGATMLAVASRNGHLGVVKHLLEQGADVNLEGGNCDSPLVSAAEQGHIAVVGELLEHGGDVNIDSYGRTPLNAASFQGHTRVVEKLLDHGANMARRDGRGVTPLFNAACVENVDIVELLIDRGADVNQICAHGMTPLHIAAQHGFCAHGMTSLHVAAQQGFTRVVETLLEHGADVDATEYAGQTALYIVSRTPQALQNHVDIAQILIDKGADVDKGLTGDVSNTPLRAAAYGGNTAAVRVLLAAGAKVRDEAGWESDLVSRRRRGAIASDESMSWADVLEMKRGIGASRSSSRSRRRK